jgi:hypothetical protein
MDVGYLFCGVIIGNQGADQSGMVLRRELLLVRDVVGPEVGVVERE